MKVLCGLFAAIFGITAFSSFYNAFSGRNTSSPIGIFLFGVIMTALAILCIFGLTVAIGKEKETGSATIVKTKIVDAYGKTSTTSAAARGVVGNVVAGPLGAVVGATTAKSKRSTTFLIIYKSGKKLTKTVPNNSFEYQKYVKYLDD